MARRPRVLVLGASGWLGGAVVPAFAARFDVVAPARAEADVADADAVRRALLGPPCDAVVNLATANPPADEATMQRVNSAGAAATAAAARDAGVRLLHLSTDMVFDGTAAPYSEDAPASPVNAYGASKAAGEDAVRALHPAALVVRTSLLFDPAVPDRFTASVLDRLARGEAASLFVDEIRCPLARRTLAEALAELVLRGDVSGTLHVAGTQALSRHDLALRLLRRFGAARLDLARPVRAADTPAAASRPRDLTLDVSRARALLRTALRSVDDELTAP